MKRAVVLALILVGCGSENGIVGDEEEPDIPNPLEIEDVTRTDRFIQTPPTVIDVLFVIDDSGSMLDEQDELAANFPSFFQWFQGSGVDYHVGVTSTDMDNPAKMGRLSSAAGLLWIDPDTPSADSVFSSMALLGTNGTGNEAGIGAAYSALELRKDGYNAGFIRDGGSLQVINVSDEQDHTTAITKNEFAQYLLGLEASKEDVGYSSIVTPPGVFGINGETPGTDYLWVTSQVGGQYFDIREQDWSSLLDALGMEALGLKREFFLSQVPVVDTIEVTVRDDDVTWSFLPDEDWTYDEGRNSVTFLSFVPDPYAEVLIDYTMRSTLSRDH